MPMDLDLGDTQMIIEECRRQGILRNQTAYLLATAYWETARTMKPVEEAFWVHDDDPVRRKQWLRDNLRYYPWHGRGHVQCTWERNYRRVKSELGADVVSDPDLLLRDSALSAAVLVRGCMNGWWTGRKIGDYITLKKSNYVGARKVVNGKDKAQAIAELAREYEGDLLRIGYGVDEPDAEIANDRRDGTAPRGHVGQTKTIWAMIMAALGTASQVIEPAKEAVAPVAEALGLTPEQGLAVVVAGGIAFVIYDRNRKFKTQDDR